MAYWIQCTVAKTDPPKQTYLNLDLVTSITRLDDVTSLSFQGGDDTRIISETPEEILLKARVGPSQS